VVPNQKGEFFLSENASAARWITCQVGQLEKEDICGKQKIWVDREHSKQFVLEVAEWLAHAAECHYSDVTNAKALSWLIRKCDLS